jgi:tripartite-type tricarboxylate transporter receptor subunit TctC
LKRVLATRIPAFMYLTDFRERRLKDVITKLNQALVTALSDEKIKVRLTELAVDYPTGQETTPEALGNQLKVSIDKWVPAVRAAGVKPE